MHMEVSPLTSLPPGQASFVCISIYRPVLAKSRASFRRGRGQGKIQCRRDRRTSDSSMFIMVKRDFENTALQSTEIADHTTHHCPCIAAVLRRCLSAVLVPYDLSFALGLTRQKPMPAPPLAAQQVAWTFSPCRTAGKRVASRHPSNSSIHMLWKNDIKCVTR